MKKILTGTTWILLLAAASGFAEARQTATNAAHLSTCPHCGFTTTNNTAAVSAAAGPALSTNRAARDWKSSVYGGFSAQSGNANTKAYNYGGEYSRNGKLYRGKLKADGKYGETEDQVTVSKSEAAGEMRRMLNEHWFAYGVLSALHDGLKDLTYRVKTGPGLGYYFIDSKELKVDFSSGPLYVHEKTSKTDGGYLAWRFAQGVDWQITDTFRWWSLAELDVETTDTSAYTFEVKTGVESKINDRVSLLVTMEDDYDSHPEAKGNIEKNDFQISTGIRYNF